MKRWHANRHFSLWIMGEDGVQVCQAVTDKDADHLIAEHNALVDAAEALENLIICPAFNGALFERDKESHKAWTLGRDALAYLTWTKPVTKRELWQWAVEINSKCWVQSREYFASEDEVRAAYGAVLRVIRLINSRLEVSDE